MRRRGSQIVRNTSVARYAATERADRVYQFKRLPQTSHNYCLLYSHVVAVGLYPLVVSSLTDREAGWPASQLDAVVAVERHVELSGLRADGAGYRVAREVAERPGRVRRLPIVHLPRIAPCNAPSTMSTKYR